MAAETFAERGLVSFHQLLKGQEGLSCGDVITTVVVQRFDFVVLDMIGALLLPVFDRQSKPAWVLLRLSDKECSSGIYVAHQIFFRCPSADLPTIPPAHK